MVVEGWRAKGEVAGAWWARWSWSTPPVGVELASEAAPLGDAPRGGRGLGVGALGGHRKVDEWRTARESVHSAWTAKGLRGGGQGARGSRASGVGV